MSPLPTSNAHVKEIFCTNFYGMAKNTTQFPRPGLEPGPLAPGTSALTIRPPRLPSKLLLFCKNVKPSGSQSAITSLWTITRESQLQTFQFKLLHRRRATNSYLFKIGITSVNLWSFFKKPPETILHMFWKSAFVKAFWDGIRQWTSSKFCFPNKISPFQTCLGFVDSTSNILFHHFLLYVMKTDCCCSTW